MKKKLSQNQQSKTEEKTHSIYVIIYRIINRMFAMCVCGWWHSVTNSKERECCLKVQWDIMKWKRGMALS